MSLPFAFPIDEKTITSRRAQILDEMIHLDPGFASTPITSISSASLETLLRMYDESFFEGNLLRTYKSIPVSLSSRMLRAAGKVIRWNAGNIEIRMSSDFFFRLSSGPFHLNGLSLSTIQEAFLIVFEHELCHAADYALRGRSGHDQYFKTLAFGLFGHTSVYHELPTRKKEAAAEGICVGLRASFIFEGKHLTGTITYIGKTATVMVPDPKGSYRGRFGRRYAKYRVPLSDLTPL